MSWECVSGLEAHVQLSTETKLFSRASTSFGQEPNTNVNLVDCGLPGVLPTVNKNAFYKACLLYTSPSPRDKRQSRMPSSA